jgi:hypothetical protein
VCLFRVVIPGHYYWQNSMSLSDPVPGSGMSIAKKFLTTIISQFIDRRMFVYFFRHDYNGKLLLLLLLLLFLLLLLVFRYD